MPYYLLISLKNVFRDMRRSVTLGINYLFIAFLLLMVFSVTRGVNKNVTENVITSTAGHITISGEYIVKGRTFQGIRNHPRIDSVTRALFPDVRINTRYGISSAVYHQGASKRLSFIGIHPESDKGIFDQITITGGSLDAFVNDPAALIIPDKVAEYFGLKINDDLLVSTRSRFGAFNTATFQVRGTYRTGNYFLREQLISHFGYIQSLDLSDSITASKMFLFFNALQGLENKRDLLAAKLREADFIAAKPKSSSDAINAVSAASPRYKVQDESVNQTRLTLSTIDEVTSIVSQIVAAINGTGLFVAAIMLFIIAISIFINMRMVINERIQEIGTLRALGTERRDIIFMFIAENVFLETIFAGVGIVAGLIIMAFFSRFVVFPSDGTIGLFLNRGHFVLEPSIAAIAFIMGALAFFTALFSYFPARYGGKIPVVTALSQKSK
jgi:putative ABC transport system permease protein